MAKTSIAPIRSLLRLAVTVIAHNKSKTFKFQNYEKNKHFSYRGSLTDEFIHQ